MYTFKRRVSYAKMSKHFHTYEKKHTVGELISNCLFSYKSYKSNLLPCKVQLRTICYKTILTLPTFGNIYIFFALSSSSTALVSSLLLFLLFAPLWLLTWPKKSKVRNVLQDCNEKNLLRHFIYGFTSMWSTRIQGIRYPTIQFATHCTVCIDKIR